MSNPITGSSDAWAQLVANIGPLMVLVGEKHVKAYFKTMHKTSHHLLFAASPIGLVTAVTTIIRLSEFQLLKRLIGRQFEPRAQVLLDVTSISCGEVGLELIGGSLEQSVNPSPDNVALFWISGEKCGAPDELAKWIRANKVLVIEHINRIKDDTRMYSCYSRRSGIATVSVARGKGPGAVWLAREKALTFWREGRGGKDALRPDDSRDNETMKLRAFCKVERTKICPNNNTTCEATGIAIAHLSDVSHVLTASENRDSRWLNALTYAFVLFSLCCNVGIVVAIRRTGGAPLTAGLVGGGLLVTGAGSWFTALAVDRASKERKLELSHFGGTAAGFVSRDDPQGVLLARCPKRAIVSARLSDYSRSRHFNGVAVPALLVFLMVGGFVALYLGLRSSPWWVSLCALGVAAVTSCARSMLDPQILRDWEMGGAAGIHYAIPGNWGWESQLHFRTERDRPLVARCSFPSHATDSDSFLVYDSYEVAVPTAFIWADDLQSLPWKIPSDSADWSSPILLAIHLAHEMRVQSIAPFELGRFGRDDINPAGLVFLHSDLLTPDYVLRQPLEVLVAPEDASRPGAIIESISVAFYNLVCRAHHLPCCVLGRIDTTRLSLGLHVAPMDRATRDGIILQLKEITWNIYPSEYFLDPLVWAVAKVIYVIMLNVAEGAMLEIGRIWFPQSSTRSEDGIRPFLQSMQSLNLVVPVPAGSGGINLNHSLKPPSPSPSPPSPSFPSPSPSPPSSSSPPLNHPSSSHSPPSYPPPLSPPRPRKPSNSL